MHALSLHNMGDKLVRAVRGGQKLTASFGLTVAQPSRDATLTGKHLIERADEALAQALSQGGNRAAIVDVPDAFYSDVAFV